MSRVPPLGAPTGGRARAGRTLATVVQAPFTRRARNELLFCLVGVLIGPAGLAVFGILVFPGTAASLLRGGAVLGVLLLLIVGAGTARGLAAAWRLLAARLLGEVIPPPPAFRPGRGAFGRLATRLRDGTS